MSKNINIYMLEDLYVFSLVYKASNVLTIFFN